MADAALSEGGDFDSIPTDGLDGTACRPSSLGRTGTMTELGVGLVLLGIAALAGLAFVHRPWPNRLDLWGDRLLAAQPGSLWAHDFVTLGSLTVLIAGAVLVFFIGIRRDWVRAIACATAPVIAVLVVQEIAKPLVDRHNVLTGGLSYPSGTVAAVAALATALTLVIPAKARIPVALLGLLAIGGTGAAVIVLRWHYPTDALGGVAVGVGAVLVVDAVLHIPKVMAGMTSSARLNGLGRVDRGHHPGHLDVPRLSSGVRVHESPSR
jgi:membrane-associated phospholipid phosphatase